MGGRKREGKEQRVVETKEMATAVNGEAGRWLLVSVLESQGLPAHALPWRKRPLPGGGLGIMVNIIDTPIRQLSLFPPAKQSQEKHEIHT